MGRTNKLSGLNNVYGITKQDLHVSLDDQKSTILRIIDQANTGIIVSSSTDMNGLTAASGTGNVVLGVDDTYIVNLINQHSTSGGGSETDPVFTASPAYGITSANVTNWNTAFGWGNHATQGYLKTETDPVFVASPAYGITSANITNWNTAFSWGNHAGLYVTLTGNQTVAGNKTFSGVTVFSTASKTQFTAYGKGTYFATVATYAGFDSAGNLVEASPNAITWYYGGSSLLGARNGGSFSAGTGLSLATNLDTTTAYYTFSLATSGVASSWYCNSQIFVDPYGRVTSARSSSPITLTDGATITWDVTQGMNAQVTLAGNRSLSITNTLAGTYGTIRVKQDATGNRTLTLPSGSKVANGGLGVINLSTAANAVDILSFYFDGGTYYFTIGLNYT